MLYVPGTYRKDLLREGLSVPVDVLHSHCPHDGTLVTWWEVMVIKWIITGASGGLDDLAGDLVRSE